MKKILLFLALLFLGLEWSGYAFEWGSTFDQGDFKLKKNSFQFTERSPGPSTPPADNIKLYAKDSAGTTKLYTMDSTGTETEVGSGSGSVSDDAYDSSWNGDTTTAPSKNAVYDKVEALVLGSGSGDVTGPASSTDNAIARFDSTTGKVIQNSAATIADTTGDITAGKYNTVAISGTATPTLAVTGTTAVSGTNTGDQTSVSGNAGTATALAENGLNCSAGSYPLGVDASGAVESCTDVTTELSAYAQPLDSDLTSWAGVTRAAGFDTFVATPSSANLINLISDETGSGAAVFATSPTLVTPTLGAASATTIELQPSPASDLNASGIIASHQANNTCAFGDVMYQASDGNYSLADADLTTTMPGVVMCVESITATNSGAMMHVGYARNDAWNWTVGGLIYISTTGTTGNTLTQTAPSGTGDQVQVVGYATHADRMYFDPSLVLVEVA